jgi:uncharacterized protein (TIGR00369 family)
MTAVDEVTEPAGLRLLRERFMEGPPVEAADLLGMRPADFGVGHAAFVVDAKPEFSNPMGTVHGGIVATLLDSALGCAVQTTLGEGVGYTTISLEVKYLRAIGLDAGELRAEAFVVHAGRRQATAEARLTDRDGRVLATATTTCLILGSA